MSYRRGLLWISRQTLMVQPNNTTNAVSPILQRGAGYRLPTDTSFSLLKESDLDPITSQEIIQATNLFYDQGIHPHTICFGGGYSEPLADLPMVLDTMSELRMKRHGVPLVLMTNGLNNERQPDGYNAAQEIIRAHEEWRDAPGSDGDSKLSVWVHIAANTPPLYKKVMEPTETKKGFQEMCGFVATLAEAGVTVSGECNKRERVIFVLCSLFFYHVFLKGTYCVPLLLLLVLIFFFVRFFFFVRLHPLRSTVLAWSIQK